MSKYAVILFESNNYAMWCKDSLKENKLAPKLMNVPRNLSSDCGYCVRVAAEHVEKAVEIMKSEDIEYQDVVILED